MNDAPSRKQDQFIVRLPDGMRDKIKESAAANNRSMNAEIVNALDMYLALGDLGVDASEPNAVEQIHSVSEKVKAEMADMLRQLEEKTVENQRQLDAMIAKSEEISQQLKETVERLNK